MHRESCNERVLQVRFGACFAAQSLHKPEYSGISLQKGMLYACAAGLHLKCVVTSEVASLEAEERTPAYTCTSVSSWNIFSEASACTKAFKKAYKLPRSLPVTCKDVLPCEDTSTLYIL